MCLGAIGDVRMYEGPFYSWPSRYGGHLVFARVCPKCNRFVKPDKAVVYRETIDGLYEFEPNATCSKHGAVLMPFVGDM